jgi:glycosyltransferase involved in cell wall biosynthesis
MIDDGSYDDSSLIFANFAQIDERFRLLKNEKNLGESSSVNKGWSNRKGNLVCVLSCDDPQPDKWLEEMVAFYEQNSNSNYIVFYPNRNTIDSSGQLLRSDQLLDWKNDSVNEDFICIPSVGAIIDCSKLPSDFTPRNALVDYPSDLIQYMEISKFGSGLRHPTFYCNWRMHKENKSSINARNFAKGLEDGIKTYFQNDGRQMSSFQKLSLTSQVFWLSNRTSRVNLLFSLPQLLSQLLKVDSRILFVIKSLIKILFRYALRKIHTLLK